MGSEQHFPPTSRYAGLEVATHVGADGKSRVYVRRRFVPPPERLAEIGEHTVTGGDRLDRVTASHLGDPELFWRVCDGNRALRPDDLTATPGRRLRITLPDGFPGVPGA